MKTEDKEGVTWDGYITLAIYLDETCSFDVNEWLSGTEREPRAMSASAAQSQLLAVCVMCQPSQVYY